MMKLQWMHDYWMQPPVQMTEVYLYGDDDYDDGCYYYYYGDYGGANL